MAKGKTGKTAKTIFWIIGIIIAVFVILFAAFLISEQTGRTTKQNQTLPQNQSESEPPAENQSEPESNNEEWEEGQEFSYNNLSFMVEKEGDITKFKTTIAILERYNREPINIIIYLRNNPSNLDEIPSKVTQIPSSNTYISYDSSVMGCDDIMLAAFQLSYFVGLLGVDVEGAMTSAEDIDDPDKVKTCQDASENVTVIVLQSSQNKTQIRQENNCIVLEAGSADKCKPLEIAERYILSLIELGMSEGIIEPKEF